MIYSKYFFIEQTKKRLNGGNPSAAKSFKDEDIALLLGQLINARLKADYLTNTMALGETIPEGCMLMTYTGADALQVQKYGENYSMCILPATPVKLMRDIGVFHVSRDGDEANPFIPIQAGMWAYAVKNKLVNQLMGQIAYTPGWDKRLGSFIYFYQDLTVENIEGIMVKLVVADIFDLGDFDPLPITAEMQLDIQEELYNRLVNKPVQDKTDDVTTVKNQ